MTTSQSVPPIDKLSDKNLLQGKRVGDYLSDAEKPEVVETSRKKGVKHEQGNKTEWIQPAGDCGAVLVITNRRVLMLVGGKSDEDGSSNYEISIPFTEIRWYEGIMGILKSRMTITSRSNEQYHFFVSGREAFMESERTIERAISHWTAFDKRMGKAKEHLSTIEDHLTDGNPEAASDAHRRTQELLDESRKVADHFGSAPSPMHHRIENLELRLIRSEMRGRRERAENCAEKADAALQEDEFGTAFDAYNSAVEHYGRAVSLAEEVDHHQAEELRQKRHEINKSLSELKSRPIQEVYKACEYANKIEYCVDAIDAWENALEECRSALVPLHQNPEFDGSVDGLRFQIEWAAQNLMDAYDTVARQAESRGDERRAMDKRQKAGEAYMVAFDHIKKAQDVASELRSGSVAEYDETLDRLENKLSSVGVDVEDKK